MYKITNSSAFIGTYKVDGVYKNIAPRSSVIEKSEPTALSVCLTVVKVGD